LQHQSLREIVTAQIRSMIMTGVIAPGQRLVEGRLADQLGVSRNPVREAIRTLEHTTLVEVLPRRGACATLVDPSQTRPMQELRMGLEGWIANQTALRHSAAELAQLDLCISEGCAASVAGDLEASAQWREAFRLTFDHACGNPFAHDAAERLREPVDRILAITMPEENTPRWSDLAELRDAVADRDGPCARYLVLTQLSDAVSRFVGNGDRPLYGGESHWQRLRPILDSGQLARHGRLL
jgi:DNA-binding GntR family transcriptional regulator